MKVVYLSGKITDTNNLKVFRNIFVAWKCAKKLSKQGLAVVCPHTNGVGFGLTHKQYMERDFALLERCDVIYMMKNWKTSKGAKMELKYAKKLGLEIKFL